MADTSVYRVYQFLNSSFSSAEAWKNAADENYGDNDGVLTKDELCNFMLDLNDLWTDDFGDTESAKKDVINRFWASIDSITTGKVKGKANNNKNAMDATEFSNSEKIMKATEEIDNYMATQYPPTISGISIDAKAWKESVSAGLLNKVIELVQSGNEYDLESMYNLVSNKATADYMALDIMPQLIEQQFGQLSQYKIGSDKIWANILNNYIETITGESSPDQIANDIENLVRAYIDTAVNNSENSIELLKQYGYKEQKYMNDLQYAVIEQSTRDSIIAEINSNNEYADIKSLYEQRAEDVDKIINTYLTNTLKDKKSTDFTECKNNVSEYVANFFNSKELNTLLTRFNLNNNAINELNKNEEIRTGAIQAIFGTTDPEELAEGIEGYDDESLQSQADLFQRTFDIINKLGNDYLTTMGLPSTMTGKQGEAANTIKLNNNSGIELTYMSTSPLSVSNDGTVTMNTSVAGKFTSVVDIYTTDSIKVGSKTVSIDITPDVKFSYGDEEYDSYDVLNSKENTFVTLVQNVRGYDNAAKAARTSLATLLTSIKNGMSGVDSSLLDKAYNTMYDKYCMFINSVGSNIIDGNGAVGNSITYHDFVNDKDVTVNDKSNMRSAWDHSDIDSANEIYDKYHSGTSGLYIGHDKEGGDGHDNDKFCIYFDLKVILREFLSYIY